MLLNKNFFSTYVSDYFALNKRSVDCTGVFNPDDLSAFPCENGLTFAFWFKIMPTSQSGYVYYSHIFQVLFESSTQELELSFLNGTQFLLWNNVGSLRDVIANQWQHFAATFNNKVIPSKFIDGCKRQINLGIISSSPLPSMMTSIGCDNTGSSCAFVAIDDFHVYSEKKDEHFMWLFFDSFN